MLALVMAGGPQANVRRCHQGQRQWRRHCCPLTPVHAIMVSRHQHCLASAHFHGYDARRHNATATSYRWLLMMNEMMEERRSLHNGIPSYVSIVMAMVIRHTPEEKGCREGGKALMILS